MPSLRAAGRALLLLSSVLSLVNADAFDDLYSCLWSGSFKVVTPSSYDYVAASTAYNLRLSIAPAAIVYPAKPNDVSHAVTCAAKSKVDVAARSGGHSYAGHSLGGHNGSLVIDLALLTKLDVSEDGETAVIQTGNRLGDVASGLYYRGRRALPHGTCPYVGLGGHAGFGGFGFLSREWGLLLDRILAAEVVLADGSIVNCSQEENSDVFWAIRGSPSSFGIITSFTFILETAPPVTTNYNYTFVGTHEDAASCFMAYQQFGQTAPAKLGMQFSIANDLTWRLKGSYNGPKSEFEEIFLPLVKQCSTLDLEHTWVEEQEWLSYLVTMAGDPPRVTDCFYAKSVMTHEDTPLSYATILSFFSHVFAESPSYNLIWFVEVNVYGGVHSAINAVPQDATAYDHRDRLLVFQLYASSFNEKPPYPDYGFDFIDNMVKVLRAGYSEFGAYANYVDPRLSEEEWPLQYYGHQYARLATIKQKVDPNGVFSYPQMIGKHGPMIAEVLARGSADAEARRSSRDEL